MTKDRPRKKAVRARMAASGEPYSVAARNLDAAAAPATGVAVAEIIACADRTLAEPSARIAFRSDFESSAPVTHASPGPVRSLISLAGKAVWERVSGGKSFRHSAGEGFIEPAADRFMIDFGYYAQIGADGLTFGGLSGRSLQTLRPSSRREGDVLWLLRLIPGATDARPEGTEALHGTLCRKYAVRVEAQRAATASGRAALPAPLGVDSAQPPVLPLTVWIDGQHIRQVRFEGRVKSTPKPARGASSAKILTLELWDFGVQVRELDWSRLPTFLSPG